jgi:tRNA pseudouridine55 synthase
LSDSGKAYRATIRFGIETDTYDAEGNITSEAPVSVSEADIRTALPSFLGDQLQYPPLYSAIKRGGQPLYKLARAGQEIKVEARPISITDLRIVAWEAPDLVLDIECGKGTYIRSLAFDLGRKLGPGAHLAALERTRSGPFTLDHSLTLEALEQSLLDGSWPDHCYSPDEALLERRAAILGERNEWRVRNGLTLNFSVVEKGNASGGDEAELLRAYSLDGRFLGIIQWVADQSAWRPLKVLTGASSEESGG